MLKQFIEPKTIALIGATNRPKSVGLALAQNLAKSQAKIFFVNPNKKFLFKKKCFGSLLEIKEGIDLVIIAVPSQIVPQIAKECALKKVKAVIIISANFAETGKIGQALEKEVAQILQKAKIPFLGPNCFGIINSQNNLNTTFSSLSPQKGKVAFLSQSGALMNILIEQSLETDGGFSLMVSLGNMADLSFEDWFGFLKKDKQTKAIALYLEGIKHGEKFINKARELSALKPIIALKAGKTAKGKKASQSHSASLAGESKVYSAAFKKAGIFEVGTSEELFEISSAFACLPTREKPLKTNKKLALLTNGGGLGVLASDYLSAFEVNNFSLKDLIGSANENDYQKEIEECLKQKDVRILLVIVSSQMMTKTLEIARKIVKSQNKFPQKPIISCFLAPRQGKKALDFLNRNKQPVFNNLKNVCLFIKFLNDTI